MRNISQLISTINDVHSELQSTAANAVNKALTVRNWLIGYYILEYEQNGEDRAQYGDKVIDTLAQKLKTIKGVDRRSLYKFRQFYVVYQYLTPTVKFYLKQNFGTLSQNSILSIVGSLTPQLDAKNESDQKVGSVTTLSTTNLLVPSDILISKLSYTHLEMLLNVSEPLKRTF